jgi:transposase
VGQHPCHAQPGQNFPFSAWVFNKRKHFRAVATRYAQHDDNFLVSVQLSSIRIWLKSYGYTS